MHKYSIYPRLTSEPSAGSPGKMLVWGWWLGILGTPPCQSLRARRKQAFQKLIRKHCKQRAFKPAMNRDLQGVPSWEQSQIPFLKALFESMIFLFPNGGICDRSLEGNFPKLDVPLSSTLGVLEAIATWQRIHRDEIQFWRDQDEMYKISIGFHKFA